MQTATLESGKLAFQGDLGFRRVKELPKNAKEQKLRAGRIVLANPNTGHQHAIKGDGLSFFEGSDPLRAYIRFDTTEQADVVHERDYHTHETVRLAVGQGAVIEVLRQREHSPEGWRRVED